MGRSRDCESANAVEVAIRYVGRQVFGRAGFQAQAPADQPRHGLCFEFALPLRELVGATSPPTFLIAAQMSTINVAHFMNQCRKSLRQVEAAVDPDLEPCSAGELGCLRTDHP